MPKKMTQKLREQLISQHREIFEMISHLESDLKTLEGRDIEMVDGAQKDSLNRILKQLHERGNKELNEIDLALERMAAGTYGTCEICLKQIAFKRLAVLPDARLCRKCAQKYEKAQENRQHPRDEIIDADLLEAYRSIDHEKVSFKAFKLARDERLMDLNEV